MARGNGGRIRGETKRSPVPKDISSSRLLPANTKSFFGGGVADVEAEVAFGMHLRRFPVADAFFHNQSLLLVTSNLYFPLRKIQTGT